MSDRITIKDVRNVLEIYVNTLASYGLDMASGPYDDLTPRPITVHLQEGSRTYGRAWRLFYSPKGQTGHYDFGVGNSYLGATAREAYDTLIDRAGMTHDLARAWGIKATDVVARVGEAQ